MLGIYISGHPLEKYKSLIEKVANVNILQLKQANETMYTGRMIEDKHLNSQSAENEQIISENQNIQ